MSSYYDVLGVKKEDNDQTIKKAYMKLCLKYHPDKCANKEESVAKMQEINEAYDVLKDKEKRQLYDRFGKEGLNGGTSGPSFEDLFGFGKHEREEREIVQPIQIKIPIELKDISLGKTGTISYERRNLCEQCDGTGCKNKIRLSCESCDGKGYEIKEIRHGPMIQQIQVGCNICKGRGISKNADICDKCKGNCFVSETVKYQYNIPKGTFGQAIIPNIGHEIPKDVRKGEITRGKVVLILVEKAHPIFERNGSDLSMEMEITLGDALCGFNKTIEHVDGRKLAFIRTKPVNNGDVIILSGEGLPIQNKYGNGNLYITIKVLCPNDLTHDEKKIIYKTLTKGKDLDDLDFTVPADHVLTHECEVQDDTQDGNDIPGGQRVQCAQQ